MKKYRAFSSSLFLVAALAACSDNSGNSSTQSTAGVTAEVAEANAQPQVVSEDEPNKLESDFAAAHPNMAETPPSLTGGKISSAPNPHAQLTPEQHISVALQHAQEGRVSEALDVLTQAIEQIPEHPGLLGARGSLMLGQERITEALEDLERAVKLAPDSALLLVNRSQAYRKFNRLQDAMTDLDRAVELSPNLVPALFNRGVLHFGEADYEAALSDFDRCVELDDKAAAPYLNRAMTRDALGDTEGAKNDLKAFIAMADAPEWRQVAEEALEGIERREAHVIEMSSPEKQEN